jgi:hypothetical protein
MSAISRDNLRDARQLEGTMAAREVIGTNARQVVLDEGATDELRARVRGRLVRRGDERYDERRKVWNGMIVRNPALIVECTGTADVIAAVNFARDRILPISVRGGGHNVAGTAISDGGVVIDLSRMNNVRVDPLRKTARVGGGATLGQVDHETQAFALAVPAGLMSRTGIAGLSLHGGLGALTRHYGLTCDNLIGADVITAEGRVLVVDKQNHPDLLWALRGGGGNFGVVTSFEFRLHPVGPEVWMAIVMYPVEKAPGVLRFFREHMAQAPDELMALAVFWNTPPEEPMPEGARNVPAIILFACYSGPFDLGESAIQPLREIDTPLADLSGPMPFLAAQQLFDPDYPDNRRYYWKSIYLRNLDDTVIDALRRHASRRPSPISSLDIWALGGAMNRVAASESAFARRDAPFLLGIESNWDDSAQDEVNVAWAREVYQDMQSRFPTAGAYLNFAGFAEEGEALLKMSFDRNYARLQEIKAKYDPSNLFRSNLNITPASTVR